MASYDYQDLIHEIEQDIKEGLLSFNQKIKVERAKIKAYGNYYPVLDYEYSSDGEMTVLELLTELNYHNQIIK
ncbi:hypothetical protein HF295_06880 [Hujiaoplasma nucleasis]|uniref:Uncharacterized protein n=1 Tax=Hujiaoplasma nucleasis TaxID=2725268 RepID=A0A7L6N2T7_9MOLU|nr:hypothetical protein [Hujiaoplasma nucleasis]QLY40580.1 hypothetical protein HF295_06880 [Hujiaoplasma nucleasis]